MCPVKFIEDKICDCQALGTASAENATRSATMPLKIDNRDEERQVMLRTRDLASPNPPRLFWFRAALTVIKAVWQQRRQHFFVRCVTAVLLLSTVTGCTNTHLLSWSPFSWNSRETHRFNADIESYSIIDEKKSGTPWDLPIGFSIQPDPRSRMFDGSSTDDPELPEPGPHLHSYELPPLTPRSRRFSGVGADELSLPEPAARVEQSGDDIVQVSAEEDTTIQADASVDGVSNTSIGGLKIQPVPRQYWEAVPPACLARMLEFESIRIEYRRTYGSEAPTTLRDPSRKLTLDDIVELGQINGRDYQTQKESLYRSALALTLERFDYETKLSTGGNGVGVNNTHSRTSGVTTDTLAIPSSVQVDKMLSTGGTLLTRFANDVVLTFNGPEGFAADVSSDLVFELTQSILQRDVLLNPLVQAERNVVYAARDYARFRKQFFFNLANQYYDLLSTYRRIEIDSQNYFSLVRNFEQAQAEVRSGIQTAPNQVAVDQFEQSMLGGRRGLITSCNGIERNFDSLKLDIGLPTEMPVNLDLSELEHLTLRDQAEVAGERVRRWLGRLDLRRNRQPLDRRELLNASVFLAERIIEWLKLQKLVNEETQDLAPLENLAARLRVDQARLNGGGAMQDLEQARTAIPPTPPILLHQWTMNVIDQQIVLLVRQMQFAEQLQLDPEQMVAITQQIRNYQQQVDRLHDRLGEVLREAQEAGQVLTLTQPIQELRRDAETLLVTINEAVESTDEFIVVHAPQADEDAALQQTVASADQLLTTGRALLDSAGLGLVPVEISMDEALATALVQRLDLMNERGFLADDWRNVKLAGDDLRSVLNLGASQSIRTRDNRPFEFDLKNSTTNLNLQLDLPFNRMAQRNAFRRTLIDFQAGKRQLTEFEDRTIKFNLRNELRDLELARVQYPISVAQAALAAEQVTSIRLSLSLGIPNVRIPDLLDALDDSRNALISVANSRIGYIVQRSRFALDLEQMQLDDVGFWPEIYNKDYQPRPQLDYPAGAGMTYGEFPEFLRVSDSIRRMHGHSLPGRTFLPAPMIDETPAPSGEPVSIPTGAATESGAVQPAHFRPNDPVISKRVLQGTEAASTVDAAKTSPAKPANPKGWHATKSN